MVKKEDRKFKEYAKDIACRMGKKKLTEQEEIDLYNFIQSLDPYRWINSHRTGHQ